MKLGFNIGNTYIDGGLSLGPMAGVTDLPFRIYVRSKDVTYLLRKWSVLRLYCMKIKIL